VTYAINPPNTPLVDGQGRITSEWYRYFVQNRKQGNDLTDSDVLTVGNAQDVYPNSRALAVASGELTKVADSTSITLGLADAGTAGEYGSTTRVLILTIDTKARTVGVQEIKFDVSDVDGKLAANHGGTGQDTYVVGDILYASSTSALSRLPDAATGNVLKAGGVGSPPAYGKVTSSETTGFTGTGAYTNLEIENGLVTNAT